ncbi:MAG: cation-transporting P-type ATPase, partial [Actinomycetes bacterium]
MNGAARTASAARSDGLTAAEVAARLERDGPNRLPPPPRHHPLAELARQMVHLFALMLWAAAG